MKMNAPSKIEMKVYAVEEESGQQAVVTMSLPLGHKQSNLERHRISSTVMQSSKIH